MPEVKGVWRVVLVGAGRMGKNHLRVIQETPEFQLVGVVDPMVNSIPESILPAGVRRWKYLSECLASESFDVAVIAASTQHHFALATKLITAGKHLLVEKPLATTYDEALKLVNLSKKHRTVLKVGHLERLNPVVQKLKEVIQAGWLGTPIHFSFTRVGGYPAHVGANNNVLMDLAVHDIDVLHALVGMQPVFDVKGAALHSILRENVLDTAEILLENSRSMSASIHVNWITPTKIRSLRVTGTGGVCMVDYILQTCVLFGGDLLKNRAEPLNSFDNLMKTYQNPDKIEFGVTREEPLKIQLREFHKALSGEVSSICDGSEAAAAVAIAQHALSGKMTKPIEWAA